MKRLVGVILLVVTIHSISSGQTTGFGLGIILGEPTGVSGKYWVSQENAIDGAIAWSFRNKGRFHLHVDYLSHFPDAIQAAERFPLYIGIGGRLSASSGEGRLGIRCVGGIAFWPRKIPIDVFLEFAPILDLVPATELSANGGIGIRFFFR